jgi:cysteine desulfurase / selenocysteine lyase
VAPGDHTEADFERFRAGFPGVRNGPYLNVADRGLISSAVRDAVATYLDACVEGDSKDLARTWAERARQDFASLVHADPRDIALTKNVSEGINAVATAIDWRPGDNVVLCEELEHPSNIFPWHNLRDRLGVIIRCVEPSAWAIEPERMIAAIDGKTRLVAASMVTFAPGFRTDIVAIGEACRQRNVLFLADAAQAVGVLDIDLGRLPIDALAVGTPKALLGLYGMGFLFVRNDIAERLRPAYLSGAGIDRGALDAGQRPVPLKTGAGRFDLGNPNHVGCVAVATSMAELRHIGTAGIERHTRQLAAMLSAGLKELGLPVMTPSVDRLATNIVTVGARLEPALDSTSDRQLAALSAHLSKHRVDFSVRRGVLRFSTHAYNDRSDIEQTIKLVTDWRKSSSLPL